MIQVTVHEGLSSSVFFCVIFQNDGSQTCGVYGTIVPETCRPESAHDTCCKCLEVSV